MDTAAAVTLEGMGEGPEEAGHSHPAYGAGQCLVQGLEHNGDSTHNMFLRCRPTAHLETHCT